MEYIYLPTVGMQVGRLFRRRDYSGECKIHKLIKELRPAYCFEDSPSCDGCIMATTDHEIIVSYLRMLEETAKTIQDRNRNIIRTESDSTVFEHSGYYRGRVSFSHE